MYGGLLEDRRHTVRCGCSGTSTRPEARPGGRSAPTLIRVLDAAGSSIDHGVKSAVFVTDVNDLDAVDEVYGEYVSDTVPARSAVEVADLTIDVGVEIEIIAAARTPTNHQGDPGAHGRVRLQ